MYTLRIILFLHKTSIFNPRLFEGERTLVHRGNERHVAIFAPSNLPPQSSIILRCARRQPRGAKSSSKEWSFGVKSYIGGNTTRGLGCPCSDRKQSYYISNLRVSFNAIRVQVPPSHTIPSSFACVLRFSSSQLPSFPIP